MINQSITFLATGASFNMRLYFFIATQAVWIALAWYHSCIWPLARYIWLPKCQLTKNHIVFGQTEAWSRARIALAGQLRQSGQQQSNRAWIWERAMLRQYYLHILLIGTNLFLWLDRYLHMKQHLPGSISRPPYLLWDLLCSTILILYVQS